MGDPARLRLVRGPARRSRDRGGLHLAAEHAARRVVDQGARGRQARALREAVHAPPGGGRCGIRRRRAERPAAERGVHVPPQSADRKARGARPRRRDRRAPADPVGLLVRPLRRGEHPPPHRRRGRRPDGRRLLQRLGLAAARGRAGAGLGRGVVRALGNGLGLQRHAAVSRRRARNLRLRHRARGARRARGDRKRGLALSRRSLALPAPDDRAAPGGRRRADRARARGLVPAGAREPERRDPRRGRAAPRAGGRVRPGEGARGSSPLGDDRGAGFALAAARFHSFPSALAWGGRMSAQAAPAPTGPTFTIRGRPYPVLLPKLSDPRLHLAAVIVSLQIIGQVGFDFDLSISQILLSIGTCAVLEVGIAMRSQHVILWPASATLTGNGVAFVLRVPGTVHGDWWSLHGWWIYVGTAAVSLLSKHVIRWRGEHIFNPSNIGLVLCFLLLGRTRAAPLDFWWGPMSAWLVLALAVIVAGGFLILRRLKLLRVALGFWASFAVAIGVLALAGHTMTARWHLGPISGFQLWSVLITSPEVLVFLFFMITDPKTAPRSPRARLVYGVSLGLLAGMLIAPTTTEYAAKVALLGSLAIVCLALPILRLARWPLDRRLVVGLATLALAVSLGAIVAGNAPAVVNASSAAPVGALPAISILPAQGVQTKLDVHTAQLIAHDLLAAKPSAGAGPLRIWLVEGVEQGPPTATVQRAGLTYHLQQTADGHWALPSAVQSGPVETAPPPVSSALRGVRLTNVAPAVGLDFRQDSFRYGVLNDNEAMMGGGVCWLDYNGDGWEDLFAVNSYSSADSSRWEAHGGLPRTQLFENVRGHFRNVTARTHAGLPVQGDGCVAADLNGDGRPDLIVTTTNGIKLLWNKGSGTFTEGARAAGMTEQGWYTGVAVADVNGDGRPDVFVAGYTRPYDSVPSSLAGFPTNLAGVRDLLYLNGGNGPNGRARFREVGVQAGLEASGFSHALGATFLDANGDGRPDLYVANDEDPNQLYVDVPWPGGARADPDGLGFRFENRAATSGVADPYAGMGVAVDGSGIGIGPLDLFVTNSRHEPCAPFARTSAPEFSHARPDFDPALGVNFAGWGDSFVDLGNSGSSALVLATGGIPVTNLKKDAGPVKVVAPISDQGGRLYGVAKGVASGVPRVSGRGLAAADVDNDGRMQIAVNSIGGKLLLLKPTGKIGHWLDVQLS